MLGKTISLLRGIWVLRHAETVTLLGELRNSAVELNKLRAAYPDAQIHADVVVQGWPTGKLSLANGVRIEKGSIIALGDDFNGYGSLDVGANTWIGQYNNFRLSHDAYISIGNGCLISQFCTLVAANHHIERATPIQRSPCAQEKTNINIGDDVWLGAGTAIMPAVNIGRGAVVGANSVVTMQIPDYEIWAGAPARKIGERI